MNLKQDYNQLLSFGILIAVVFCLVSIFQALYLRSQTGILDVSAPGSMGALTVTESGKVAKTIGQNHRSQVRLRGGIYYIAASINGQLASKQVVIKRGETTSVSLTTRDQVIIPSVQNISFVGIDALVDKGLSDEQIDLMKQDVFIFNQRAIKVVLDTATISTDPHNPNVDTTWRKHFDLLIDGKRYSATISYFGISALDLALVDPQTSVTVFNSSIPLDRD
jgi:hypothetical protein